MDRRYKMQYVYSRIYWVETCFISNNLFLETKQKNVSPIVVVDIGNRMVAHSKHTHIHTEHSLLFLRPLFCSFNAFLFRLEFQYSRRGNSTECIPYCVYDSEMLLLLLLLAAHMHTRKMFSGRVKERIFILFYCVTHFLFGVFPFIVFLKNVRTLITTTTDCFSLRFRIFSHKKKTRGTIDRLI